jgi:hypothetical protein
MPPQSPTVFIINAENFNELERVSTDLPTPPLCYDELTPPPLYEAWFNDKTEHPNEIK